MDARHRTGMLLAFAAVLAACSSGSATSTTMATAAVVAMGSASATATARPEDAAAVLRAFVDAVNRGDAAGAEALLQANAAWERGGQCAPGQCSGIPRLRQEIARDIANHHRMDILSTEVAGNTATARLELRTDRTRAASVERLIQIFKATVSDGRIAAMRIDQDLTDPTTATFTERAPVGAGSR